MVRQFLLTAVLTVAACKPTAPTTTEGPVQNRSPSGSASETLLAPAPSSAQTSAPIPTETAAATEPLAQTEPASSASAATSAGSEAAAQPSASAAADSCPAATTPPGFERCYAFELTGAPPCESICQRARKVPATKCCPYPKDAVVLSGGRVLLSLPACSFVPPECAHSHGHGNMDAQLRVLAGSPPELILVEGGCEMRAMAHGYVPDGVAAWTGCNHQRYRWQGNQFVLIKKSR